MSYIDKKLYSILGSALRDARDAAEMTLSDAANSVGVTTMTIQRYEKAERKATVETVRKLCRVYGVDADELMQSVVDKFHLSSNSSLINSLELTDEEISLLADFRKLNDAGKQALLSTAHGLVLSGAYQ